LPQACIVLASPLFINYICCAARPEAQRDSPACGKPRTLAAMASHRFQLDASAAVLSFHTFICLNTSTAVTLLSNR